MAGKDNLRPPRSTEEARKWGQKGGIASGAARRAKKDARETARLFLDLPAAAQLDENLEKLGIASLDRTNLMGIIARLALKAQSGDVHASRLLLELSGDLQKNNAENNLSVNFNNDKQDVVIYIPDNGREDS